QTRRRSFVVRIERRAGGDFTGVIELVATGAKEPFRGIEAIGPLIARMVEAEGGAARGPPRPPRVRPGLDRCHPIRVTCDGAARNPARVEDSHSPQEVGMMTRTVFRPTAPLILGLTLSLSSPALAQPPGSKDVHVDNTPSSPVPVTIQTMPPVSGTVAVSSVPAPRLGEIPFYLSCHSEDPCVVDLPRGKQLIVDFFSAKNAFTFGVTRCAIFLRVSGGPELILVPVLQSQGEPENGQSSTIQPL